jgi:hypothetical protein
MRNDILANAQKSFDFIIKLMKSALQDWSALKTKELMMTHYITFRIMNEHGEWMSQKLKEHERTLLPDDLDEQAVFSFVDDMKDNARANPYLLEFLGRAWGMRFEVLQQRVKEEGEKVFREVITLALALERLTSVMAEDVSVLRSVKEIWWKARFTSNVQQYLTWFEKAKIASIEGPIIEKFLEFHAGKAIPKEFMRWTLSVNIMEAVAQDLVVGNRDNSYAGWILTHHQVGGKIRNERTGQGPAHWSVDKKAICLSPPLPLEWADLYQTWNLAFCAQFPTFPYVITKLLIPCVSAYRIVPEAYLYCRVLALFAYLNYAFLWRADRYVNGLGGPRWGDKTLQKFWGAVNAESARGYLHKLDKR